SVGKPGPAGRGRAGRLLPEWRGSAGLPGLWGRDPGSAVEAGMAWRGAETQCPRQLSDQLPPGVPARRRVPDGTVRYSEWSKDQSCRVRSLDRRGPLTSHLTRHSHEHERGPVIRVREAPAFANEVEPRLPQGLGLVGRARSQVTVKADHEV